MRGQSLRNGVLMLVGALVCVESLVVVLERQARPKSVDPAFYAEVEQAQSTLGARTFDVGRRPAGLSGHTRTPSTHTP
jgi:hypothetical protein